MLWWIAGFVGDKPTVDDGSLIDSNYANACSIEYLAKGYYYAAVRMYGTKTGSYKMNIGPNEDLLYRSKYRNHNRWICENNDPYYSGLRIYTNYIQYFTYEQTILFYWMLLNKEIDLGEYKEKYGMDSISPKTLLEIKDSNIPEIVDLIGFVVGIITAKATAGTSIAISAFFECASLATSINYLTKQALITKIKKECKIKETAISYDTIKYSAEYCLGLKEWYTTDVPVGLFGYNYDVIKYSSGDTYLRGEKNAKGKWAAM